MILALVHSVAIGVKLYLDSGQRVLGLMCLLCHDNYIHIGCLENPKACSQHLVGVVAEGHVCLETIDRDHVFLRLYICGPSVDRARMATDSVDYSQKATMRCRWQRRPSVDHTLKIR